MREQSREEERRERSKGTGRERFTLQAKTMDWEGRDERPGWEVKKEKESQTKERKEEKANKEGKGKGKGGSSSRLNEPRSKSRDPFLCT